MAQAGEALGASYRLNERIGSGAVGEVWTVSTADGAVLAAKLLRPEHADDAQLVERFVRERSMLLALKDPNIVSVRDLVVEGSRLAILMDYVRGGSLRDVLKEHGPLRPADALEIAAQVSSALAAAHAAGVVHRDIKPDNVLLSEHWAEASTPDVKVSDFGIAGVIGASVRLSTGLIGTPQYMSPEIISLGEAGPPADIYGLGILLYELLAGRTPFAGGGVDFTVAYRHVSSRPPVLDLPDGVWPALERLLSKSPERRTTAAETVQLLRNLAAQVGDAPALVRAADPGAFDGIERPATVVRGSLPAGTDQSELPTSVAADVGPVPDVGHAANATVFRPMASPITTVSRVPAEDVKQATDPWWKSKKALLMAGAAVVLVATMVVGFIAFSPSGSAEPDVPRVAASAHLQDAQLPTGLTIQRDASYDPASGKTRLTVKYSAQKATLSGDFLEVLPGLSTSDTCPAVIWGSVSGTRNQASITGVDVPCGWTLPKQSVPAGGSIQITAELSVSPAGDQELSDWLRSVSESTAKATADPSVKGTAYVVQRLKGINVQTASRTVTSSPLKITLVPVWGSGPDELNLLYVSPSSGKPSSMLDAVAGGQAGVRFSDGCGGALAVGSTGLTVTALQISPQCTVRASVGNFTDLQSTVFSVTSRDSR